MVIHFVLFNWYSL